MPGITQAVVNLEVVRVWILHQVLRNPPQRRSIYVPSIKFKAARPRMCRPITKTGLVSIPTTTNIIPDVKQSPFLNGGIQGAL